MLCFHFLVLVTILTSREMAIIDDLPENYIEDAVHEALAPVLAKQYEIETKTATRLDALQTLITSLVKSVKDRFSDPIAESPSG